MRRGTRTALAWLLFGATFVCCAGGLATTLAVTRPLTLGVLLGGAVQALAFRLAFAAVGLVLTLRRPDNPIGWRTVQPARAGLWLRPRAEASDPG